VAVAPSLGSRATDLTSGLGGYRLRAGDRLPVGEDRRGGPSGPPTAHTAARPLPAGGARVRVMPGPHSEWFPFEALERLCRTRYEVTPESNRMGYRLRGAEASCRATRAR
jgi:allophanate hydrolase subunit 2